MPVSGSAYSYAYASLGEQMRAREIEREYIALVRGRPPSRRGTIDAPIGRDPHHRQRMAIRPLGEGRRAVTRFGVLERFDDDSIAEPAAPMGRGHEHAADSDKGHGRLIIDLELRSNEPGRRHQPALGDQR